MAERKTDYFGTFLDTMKEGDAGGADPASKVLTALRADERPMKDLVGLTKNSLSILIAVVRQLEEQGLVERTNVDTLRLTDRGREYATAVMKEGRQTDAGERPSADPAGQVLKALTAGNRPMKDLVGLTKNSLSNLMAVVEQLEKLGLVERTNGDALRLTDKGRVYAVAVG